MVGSGLPQGHTPFSGDNAHPTTVPLSYVGMTICDNPECKPPKPAEVVVSEGEASLERVSKDWSEKYLRF